MMNIGMILLGQLDVDNTFICAHKGLLDTTTDCSSIEGIIMELALDRLMQRLSMRGRHDCFIFTHNIGKIKLLI